MAKRALASKRRTRPKDVAMVVDRTEDQQGYQILRRRGEDAPIEIGTIRPLQEGKPIDGEVVSLKPRKDVPFVFDVKTELEAPAERRSTSQGPAQVASNDYRRGWDAIFAGERPDTSAKPN